MNPVLIVVLLAIIGATQIIAGIYLLAGFGWAILALGILTIFAAVILRRGIAVG